MKIQKTELVKRKVTIQYCDLCGSRMEDSYRSVAFKELRVGDGKLLGCAGRDYFEICSKCKDTITEEWRQRRSKFEQMEGGQWKE
jgi:hypothetical protein